MSWVVVALSALVFVRTAHADRAVPQSRIESARGMGMGTGARAAAASTQAQADNPANLALGGLYHIESFVGYDPTFKRTAWGGSVVDSMTSGLAAGISARVLFGDNDAGRNDGWEMRLGLALPLFQNMLSLGVAGRYSRIHVSDPRAFPDSAPTASLTPAPALTVGPDVDQTFRLRHFTLDASATLRPVQGLSIAALGYNLIDTHSKLAPQIVGGSVVFNSGPFAIGGDALVDMNRAKMFAGPRVTFGGGVEYLASGVAPLRLGYMYDTGRTQSFVTGGIGYIDARFAIQMAVRQSVNKGSETSLFFSASVFVQ